MINFYKLNCNSGIGGIGGTGGNVGIGCVTVKLVIVAAGAFTPPAGAVVVVGVAAGAVFATAAAGAAATLLLTAITCAGTAGIAGTFKAVGNKLVFATVVTGDIVSSGAATAGAIAATVGAGGIVGTCGGT